MPDENTEKNEATNILTCVGKIRETSRKTYLFGNQKAV